MSLVFDFDGVLVDTLQANIEAINAFSRKYKFPRMTVAVYTRMLDHNFTEYWQMMLGAHAKYFLNDLHTYPRPHPQLIPHMRELLLDFKPAIVSSNTSHLIRHVLQDNHVHVPVYGVDDHPSKIVKLLRLAVEPNVFVTDTAGDVLEGKRAGYFVIAVTWGFTPVAVMRKSQPHAIVNTPHELRLLLEKAQKLELPLVH